MGNQLRKGDVVLLCRREKVLLTGEIESVTFHYARTSKHVFWKNISDDGRLKIQNRGRKSNSVLARLNQITTDRYLGYYWRIATEREKDAYLRVRPMEIELREINLEEERDREKIEQTIRRLREILKALG